jgi:hypothetical protein
VIPIDILPDDVLLAIFDFYADEDSSTKNKIEAWQSLVHVCRRWRTIIFISPRRLNLRLVCTPGTPTRDKLDVWPAFPLVIWGEVFDTSSMDNIAAALKHSNRVHQINLRVMDVQLENLWAEMQRPFPELAHLELWSCDEVAPVLPSSFLHGHAPGLRFLWLSRIPFPGLQKLLLSATHLVDLHLLGIPHSGYISPEAILTALSMLTSLQSFSLKFQSPLSRPDREIRHLPLSTRCVLPALTYFWFKGVGEYLDSLVAYIDAPQLEYLDITFFNDLDFDTPQLTQFISRTPTLIALENAHVSFETGAARVNFSSQISGYGELSVEISCRELDWQLSSLEQVCTSCLPPSRLSTLEDLHIVGHPSSQPDQIDHLWDKERQEELNQWLELLRPFSAVKNLYLSEVFAPHIMAALQELVGGRTTEVLPTLRNIFLEGPQPSGPIQEAIGQFIAARQVTGRPIVASPWGRRTRL